MAFSTCIVGNQTKGNLAVIDDISLANAMEKNKTGMKGFPPESPKICSHELYMLLPSKRGLQTIFILFFYFKNANNAVK